MKKSKKDAEAHVQLRNEREHFIWKWFTSVEKKVNWKNCFGFVFVVEKKKDFSLFSFEFRSVRLSKLGMKRER